MPRPMPICAHSMPSSSDTPAATGSLDNTTEGACQLLRASARRLRSRLAGESAALRRSNGTCCPVASLAVEYSPARSPGGTPGDVSVTFRPVYAS
jgi:hypothetical protein